MIEYPYINLNNIFTILYFNYYIFSFIINNLFDYIINKWLMNLIKYMIWIHNIEIKFSINLSIYK